nr:Mitochondrial biogenesis AIM24 domain-containing protein [Oceanusvirus sp.]
MSAPKAHITGTTGFNRIQFFLMPGEAVKASPGSMVFYKGDVSAEQSVDEWPLDTYEGVKHGARIEFAPSVPGNVFCVAADSPLAVSKTAFLCSAETARISTSSDASDFLVVESGKVWLAAYGSHDKHALRDGETMVVNPGFLMATDAIRQKKATAGSELVLKGPGVVYTQSRSVADLGALLKPKRATAPKKSGTQNPDKEQHI